jgi:hypothetical protein
MIYKIITSLHIYSNQDEFFQTGLIGLWQLQSPSMISLFLEKETIKVYCEGLTEKEAKWVATSINQLSNKEIAEKEIVSVSAVSADYVYKNLLDRDFDAIHPIKNG